MFLDSKFNGTSKRVLQLVPTLLCSVCFVFTNSVSNKTTSEILERLNKDDVVFDLIRNASYIPLEVHYGGYVIDFGNEIPPTAMGEPPTVKWPAPIGAMYTLVCVGPDVPTRLKYSERSWLHWHIGNILGNNTANGDVRVEYVGIVEPDYGPGLHRIVFLLFRQNNDKPLYYINDVMRKDGDLDDRSFFSPRVMSKEHGLGDPVAVNYMMVTV